MARILVVEDEPLISMMLEDWLAELGHETVGTAESLEQAVSMANNLQFDAAILDLNLRSQRSDPVAEILLARNIPYAVSSGSIQECNEPPFAGKPMLAKPYDYAAIRDAIASLLVQG